MMKIEIYTIRQLQLILSEKDFWFQKVVPITKHRAQLVINSPRSEPEDPVLFVAREGDVIIGYRLIFPDRIYLKNKVIKLGWGSSFWVDLSHRGQGIGRQLFEKSLELWGGDIGSLIQSKDAARVYENNPHFYCFKESIGYQFILRWNSRYWLQKKVNLPKSLGWVLSIADVPINFAFRVLSRMWTSKKKPLNGLLLEYCRNVVDAETVQFVETRVKNTLTRKGIEDLNAIVRYPTSMATPLTDVINSRYYFSTKAPKFDYFYVKVLDSEFQLIGVLLMNYDGNSMRLLNYYYQSESVMEKIFDIFILHALKLKTEIITSFDEVLITYLKDRSGFSTIFDRKLVRKSFLPARYEPLEPINYKIYDGDGA